MMGSVVLKVRLKAGAHFDGAVVWRRLQMRADETFDDLHKAIQDAFKFDNDCIYCFKIGQMKIIHPENEWGIFDATADNVLLGEYAFKAGEKFAYLFDYENGYNWEFEIVYERYSKEILDASKVIGRKGIAPIQYPDEGDENWEEYEVYTTM